MKEMAVVVSSGLQPAKGKKAKAAAEDGRRGTEAVVVVAVRAAAREISKTAAVWALTHVVQHGDAVLLLAVMPPQNSGRKFWGFPLFAGDCASGHKNVLSQKSDANELCAEMMLELRNFYDPSKISAKVKVVSGSPCGIVATESKRAQASWVVLDKDLKHEEKCCMEELQCNIVAVKRSRPKVLRLNLVRSPEKKPKASLRPPPESSPSVSATESSVKEQQSSIQGPAVTPNSSPESGTLFGSTRVGASSVSSSDPGTSPFRASETNVSFKKEATKDNFQHSVNISDSESETSAPSAGSALQPWMADILKGSASFRSAGNGPRRTRTPTADALLDKISKLEISAIRSRSDLNFRGSVRDAVSLSRSAPPGPPPLCSICQHKTPVFGKPPRWFGYAELELATGGFSQANFLAEGGFGSVHRGVLPDGQAIAVKQYKLASSQGDVEFCSEVEVGDFGLARWQPDGDMGVETRVVGTFGYLAPEYAQSGQITEKADVYSFGVVLVELVTGRKAVDISRPKGQQFLTEWARPLLEECAIDDLIDPRLGDHFSKNDVFCMLHAANLCIRRDPHSRPRMSHVLRILEGDMVVESSCISAPGTDAGSRSRRMLVQEQISSPVDQDLQSQRVVDGKNHCEVRRILAWDRDMQSSSHRF
ncbi:hypothetical protein ABZP36_029920 [Zizania latifolia]